MVDRLLRAGLSRPTEPSMAGITTLIAAFHWPGGQAGFDGHGGAQGGGGFMLHMRSGYDVWCKILRGRMLKHAGVMHDTSYTCEAETCGDDAWGSLRDEVMRAVRGGMLNMRE